MTQKTDAHLLEAANDPAYLTYATTGRKELRESFDDAEKEKVKQHWEFTVEGPTRRGEVNGKRMILEFAKENLSVEQKDLKEGKIEVHNGETYFQRSAMAKYIKDHGLAVPTFKMYEAILISMPAGDYSGIGVWCVSGRQLYTLLGGELTGFRYNGTQGDTDILGMLWSSSPLLRNLHSVALTVGEDEGGMGDYGRGSLLPVRTLRTSAWSA